VPVNDCSPSRLIDIPGIPEDEDDTIFQTANMVPSRLKYRMRAASRSLGYQTFTGAGLTEKYGSDDEEGILHLVGFNGIESWKKTSLKGSRGR
jgi:hypothetical protein